MLVWKCDICKKDTFINPPSEQVKDKDGKVKMSYTKVQDDNGNIKKVPVPEIKDLKPRTYIIRLTVGSETIQKDVCKVCLDNHLKSDLKTLWAKLENIKSH